MRLLINNISIFCLSILISCTTIGTIERNFQNDADLIRLEHLQHWTRLVEDFYKIKGYYPFQNTLKTNEDIVIVKIATKNQLEYLSPGNSNYNPNFDTNASEYFHEYSMSSFVKELENTLDHEILEKYDIQKVPANSPIGYYYFALSDGYLLWITCITCGVTDISTLLMDGFTPSVNIVSSGMKGKVTKALTRDEMLSHPTYQKWINKKFLKEEWIRAVEEENHRDSKSE